MLLVFVVGFGAAGSYWLFQSSSAAPAKPGFDLTKAWGCKGTDATLRAAPGGKVGSEGSCAKAAQSIVNGANRLYPNSNWSIIGEDGKYGGQTAAAVSAYQGYMRISADGVVGPVTWEKMLDTCEYLRRRDIAPSGC
ncbi:MAG TPA: peptidoglycan-binding domain-containing protein [Verrucomicrobiae bacterium]|nr:peptidoglycan-binding domain-containing protein [Verrucomicrobiae bacterium]